MPQITLNYADQASIPDALKPYAGGGLSVSLWVGDNVAAETNPTLEAKRTEILTEKTALKQKYDALLQSSGDSATELLELRQKVASGTSATPEDLALVSSVRKHYPTIKAADLDKKLESVPTLEATVQTYTSRENNAKLFKASGFKNENVFLDLLGNKDKNPNLEGTVIETETVDGKPVEKVFAKVKQADGSVAKQLLTDYVKAQDTWKDYLPIITGDGASSQHDWLPQESSSGGDNADPANKMFDLDAIIKKQNEAAQAAINPLMPPSVQQQGAGVPQN